MSILIIILAGGSGKRLWPLSRTSKPKQFIRLPDGSTLFEKTIERALQISKDVLVITNKTYEFQVNHLLKKYSKDDNCINILFESKGKNSGPAILAGVIFNKKYLKNQKKILVLPSDHYINDTNSFREHIYSGIDLTEKYHVTFGVKPTSSSSDFGYLEIGKKLKVGYESNQFIEKPNSTLAKKMLDSNNYLWNSGVFLFDSNLLMNEFKKFSINLFELINDKEMIVKYDACQFFIDMTKINEKESISVDYLIMEKSTNVAVIPLKINWNDLGSWSSFKSLLKKDISNNFTNANYVSKNSKNNTLYSVNESKLLFINGVEDTVIVDTDDVLFISATNETNKLKTYLSNIDNQNYVDHNLLEYRPWGTYQVLLEDKFYKIKKITINPHSSLSLQSHKYRNEHWVVVKGEAFVVKGSMQKKLKYNESIYICAGEKHRLSNNTNHECIIIETQSGTYLGEDDIIRYEDIYKRYSL